MQHLHRNVHGLRAKTISLLVAAAVALNTSGLQAATPETTEFTAPELHYEKTEFRYPAILEAVDRVVLQPRVTGHLDSIDYAEGSFVAKGDPLFTIDSRFYQARIASATAALELARAEAGLAREEHERAERLRQQQVIAVEEAQARQAHFAVATARVEIAQAELRAAQLDFDYSRVRAPVSGFIGKAAMSPGNLVTPNDELAVLVAHDRLRLAFDLGERDIQKLGLAGRDQWQVRFSVPGSASQTTLVPVAMTDSEIRPGTGTLRIRAELDNSSLSLLPGMYGEAELFPTKPDVSIYLDKDAIGGSADGHYVLVIGNDNHLERIPVVVRDAGGDKLEILEGLDGFEKVVLNPQEAFVEPVKQTALRDANAPPRAKTKEGV